MAEASIDQARSHLGAIAQQAATNRQRVTLTEQGRPIPVLLSVEQLDDLEDAAAVAEYRAREADNALVVVPHEEVRRRLGLAARWTSNATSAPSLDLDDPAGPRELLDAVDRHAEDAQPASSTAYGSSVRHRRVGRHRILYEQPHADSVRVLHVGRTG